jgi:hypothetical protein
MKSIALNTSYTHSHARRRRSLGMRTARVDRDAPHERTRNALSSSVSVIAPRVSDL